jgi:hypothetical protein
MIVEYRQADATTRIHGYMMSDGPLSAATGRMVRGWHHKCYWIATKREARGDAVTGRVIEGTPSAYDIGQLVLDRDDLLALGITEAQARARGTAYLSDKLTRLREIAAHIGKGVGDAMVQEAFAAQEHGGAYEHNHHHRLDTYQLVAHLEYAHGITDARLLHSEDNLQDFHAEQHARRALQAIQENRAAEPDYQDQVPVRDWRSQFTADIE